MAQTMPCWGMRMVVVVNCCQHCAATLILIDVARACSQNLRASGWGGALLALRCVVDGGGVKFCKRTTPETYSDHS